MSKRSGAAVKLLCAEGERFDLVFMDPPYRSGEGEKMLSLISESDLLLPGALLILESGDPGELCDAYGPLKLRDRREYGRTVVSFYEKGEARP